jgi:hypothetical protein
LILVITRAPGGLAGVVHRVRGEVVETLDDIDRAAAPSGTLHRSPV